MVALPPTALTPFRYIDRLPRDTDRDIGGGYPMAAAGATAPYYRCVAVGVAVVVTSWATLPLGVLAGTLYERSRS